MENRHCGVICYLVKDIILTTINAKWIHPSLALRLLKANLGPLGDSCEIIEFALRQPLHEKLEQLLAAFADGGGIRIMGISVSIWNHSATIELLKELENKWPDTQKKPIIILGGPEVSHLPSESGIFNYADYVIRGEGEFVFRSLCEDLLLNNKYIPRIRPAELIISKPININEIKTAYHLYTDEDIAKKLIYVEASRGCPFGCEFCLSAADRKVREFPLEPFLTEMDLLINRGVKTFKFLDRTFNLNIKRAIQICEFFLEKIEERGKKGYIPPVVHFEMAPSLFPAELREILTRFPPGTLRLEIGIQTLNEEVAARIGRPSNPEKELDALRFLREETNAIIHADLIAGLPGEDISSFSKGFDRLLDVLSDKKNNNVNHYEIQLGLLKLLPGAPISRHNEAFKMHYNPMPPYEIEETSAMPVHDILRIKNFARFWELIVNRRLFIITGHDVFERFIILSDELFTFFSRNWGIGREELKKYIETFWQACFL